MRVLFAIHGPADPRTAVYGVVKGQADYLRGHGHEADVVASGDLRWMTARLDPLALPPALALTGLSRYDVVVFHSYLGWAFHAVRPLVDPHAGPATVTSFHGLEPLYFRALTEQWARQGHVLSARYRAMYGTVMPSLLRSTCRASDAVFCLNSTEARYVADHGWATPDRVHVLPNGVEAESFVERAARAPGQELLFVGQWLPIKGIDYLVAAFAALAASTRARLTCVGTGASADTVLAAFPEALRPRVRVVPSVDRQGLYDALRAADVFVFPSLSEGFSKALLEAMAAGLPIVATAVGAGVDTLRDGANALVVPPADAGAVATAVGRYLGDVDLATRHGGAARATAAHYRLDDVCRQWAERLVEVVDRRAFERERMSARRGHAVR